METKGSADAALARHDIDQAPGSMKHAASAEISALIADVEDLMARIADLNDADVSRLRSRVMHAVDAAKETLADSAGTMRRQAERAATSADEYVRESPWQAVGIAALVGAVVGILATRRS